MILICVIEKAKNECNKKPKSFVMNIIINYKKINIKTKNLYKIGLKNLGTRCLENSSDDGCLKKK